MGNVITPREVKIGAVYAQANIVPVHARDWKYRGDVERMCQCEEIMRERL